MVVRRFSPRLKPLSSHDCATFNAMVPSIRRKVRFLFRFLPLTIRQEKIDDALAHAFVLFVQLVKRNRIRLAHPTALARYAVYRVQSERRIGSQLNSRDVMCRRAQRRFGFQLISGDQGSAQGGEMWTELLRESGRTTPADLAAIRIDFAAWLQRLSGRRRRIALCLAAGEATGDAARKFRLSAARISQIRQEFAKQWHVFRGELEERTKC